MARNQSNTVTVIRGSESDPQVLVLASARLRFDGAISGKPVTAFSPNGDERITVPLEELIDVKPYVSDAETNAAISASGGPQPGQQYIINGHDSENRLVTVVRELRPGIVEINDGNTVAGIVTRGYSWEAA